MNQTAFFYQQPTVLDRNQHKDLKIRSGDAQFAAHHQAVPLVAAEFPEACLEYPIVFSRGPENTWVALALTGLQINRNSFVNEQGQWDARYVPASVRRYPFILAETGQAQMSVAVDISAPHLGEEGEPLFNASGEPSDFVRNNILPLLADFQQQVQATQTMLHTLDEAGILSSDNLQVRLADGRQAILRDIWVVNEARLQAVPDATILRWFRNGELALIHSHMLSLRNLVPLLMRAPKPVAQESAQDTTSEASGQEDKQLEAMIDTP